MFGCASCARVIFGMTGIRRPSGRGVAIFRFFAFHGETLAQPLAQSQSKGFRFVVSA